MIFLIEFFVFLLTAPTSAIGIGIAFLLYILSCLLISKFAESGKRPLDIGELIVSIAAAIALGVMFFVRWMPSGAVTAISSMLHISTVLLVGLSACLLSATSICGIYALLSSLKQLAIKTFCKNTTLNSFSLFDILDRRLNVIFYIYMAAVLVYILFFLWAGDDIQFHMQRMDAIMQELGKLGLSALPIRLYHSTAYGFGYGSPMFYGDIFILPFAAIGVLLNLSVLKAYKLMLVTVFVLTWLLAKYSFGLVIKDRKRDIAVFLYMVSVTVFENATGSWVGRDFACMFVPLCFCSFYCIIYGGREKPLKYCLLLAFSVTGLLYSNLNDAVIAVFSLFVLLLFSVKKITVKKLITIAAAALLCLGLSAWFLFPMLEQLGSQTLFVTSTLVKEQKNNLSKWTMPFVGLILPPKLQLALCGTCDIEKTAPVHYFYGMIFFITLIWLLLWKRKEVFDRNSENRAFVLGSICLVVLFMVFQTGLFPHKALNGIIGVIQFPWRVNTVMTYLACLLTVWLVAATNNKNISSALALISLCLVLATACANNWYYAIISADYSEDSEKYVYYTHSVGLGEYFPVELLEGTDRQAWKERLENRGAAVICDSEAVEFSFTKEFDSITLSYSDNDDGAEFEFPLIFYKGYTAIDIDSGERCEVGKSENGLVSIETNNTSGTVKVFYEGTVIQTVSEWISAVSAAAVLAIIVIKKKSERVKT